MLYNILSVECRDQRGRDEWRVETETVEMISDFSDGDYMHYTDIDG